MEENSPVASGSVKTAGCRSKTPGIPTSTRLQRNLAEKERRDKLNGYISELATLVPMVSNASKPLDKVSILRLSAAEMRLHFSCLNPKRYKHKPLSLPPSIMSSLDLIEKTIGGFIIVTTLTGLIVFCSRSIEDYLGYQNIDVMGNKVAKYIYEDDIKYFQSKVNSVVNSMKKSKKKKTKVIKVHMLKKPLPRSNETCRPRNMFFKISVHQNDTIENCTSGSSNQASKNTRPTKDFGYSAVVLMFIEPVRLEPEIDITYIDSNQDVYFTRHGLHGEIIYADQRISTITGYMPQDVQGKSAYEFICQSDVPIALFAQKAMFTSPDGKGVIVYRLKIRDTRLIYLQSSGQIAYKESSNEVSHFVCFNRLLSDEEGSQELKKFQQRYAPQIMAAKMLGVNAPSPTTDLAYDEVMKLAREKMIDVENILGKNPSTYMRSETTSTPDVISGQSGQEPSETLSSQLATPASVHSTERHSITSASGDDASSSASCDHNGGYAADLESMDIIMELPEQRDGGGPLRRNSDSATLSVAPYEATAIGSRKDKHLILEQILNCRNNRLDHRPTPNNHPKTNGLLNGVRRDQANGYGTNIVQSPTKVMHSMNASSRGYPSSTVTTEGFEKTLNGHRTHVLPIVNEKVLQKKSASFSAAPATQSSMNSYAVGENNGAMNGVYAECEIYDEHFPKSKNHFIRAQDGLQIHGSRSAAAASTALSDQVLDFGAQQQSQFQDAQSFSGFYDNVSLSSLTKSSNNQLSVLLHVTNGLDYCSNTNSYNESDIYGSNYLCNSINDTGVVNADVYNGGVINSKLLSTNACDSNGFGPPTTSIGSLGQVPTYNSFETIDFNVIAQKLLQRNIELEESRFYGTAAVKPSTTAHQESSLLSYSNMGGCDVAIPADWTEVHPDPVENADVPLNKELYNELDLFFQSFPPNAPQSTSMTEAVSEYPLDSSSYPQLSISSSWAKTNCHQ